MNTFCSTVVTMIISLLMSVSAQANSCTVVYESLDETFFKSAEKVLESKGYRLKLKRLSYKNFEVERSQFATDEFIIQRTGQLNPYRGQPCQWDLSLEGKDGKVASALRNWSTDVCERTESQYEQFAEAVALLPSCSDIQK